jgi:hypothetical protein
LDEGFWPGYYEDVDYCLRALAQGYLTWYCADAVMTHQETSSMIDRATIQRFFHRGRLRMTLKHLAPERWLNEFASAEMGLYLGQHPQDQVIWQTVYLETIPAAPGLLTQSWSPSKEMIQQVVTALARLAQVQWAPSPLPEFEFRSTMPVLGGLLVSFRRLWYGMAAKWAVRHLQHQQQALDETQERQLRQYERQLALLQNQIDQLVLKNAALAQQLLCLHDSRPAGHAGEATEEREGAPER